MVGSLAGRVSAVTTNVGRVGQAARVAGWRHRRCVEMVGRLRVIGVDEIACLIDFGVPRCAVLESPGHLAELRPGTQ